MPDFATKFRLRRLEMDGRSKLPTQHLDQVPKHPGRIIVSHHYHKRAEVHNIVSSDQMLRNVLKYIKEMERDVGREPFLGRPMLGRDIKAVYLGRGREVGKDLCDPDGIAAADVCDSEVLGFGRDGRVQHVLEAV